MPQPKDPTEYERQRLARSLELPANSPWFTIRANQWWRSLGASVSDIIYGKAEGWTPGSEHGEELAAANATTLWPKHSDFKLPYAGPAGHERWEQGREAARRSKLAQTEEGKERLEYEQKWDTRRKIVADIESSLVPGLSEYREVRETIEGEDLIWREKLSGGERAITAGAMGVPALPGGLARKVVRGGVEIIVDAAGKLIRRFADDSVEAIKNFEKLNPDWKWTKKATSGENSELLRKNLGEPAGDANHAHHILASTHPDAEEARHILEQYRIDINSKDNGVYLTKHQHEQTKLHTKANIAEINKRITALHDAALEKGLGWEKMRVLITFELSLIRDEIINGKFPPLP